MSKTIKLFYINNLSLDRDVVIYNQIKFIRYHNNGNIWTPNKKLFFKYSLYKPIVQNNITLQVYDYPEWQSLPIHIKTKIRSNCSIKEVKCGYKFASFGYIQHSDNISRWSPSVDLSICRLKYEVTNNMFNFDDIVFATNLQDLKDFILLE